MLFEFFMEIPLSAHVAFIQLKLSHILKEYFVPFPKEGSQVVIVDFIDFTD